MARPAAYVYECLAVALRQLKALLTSSPDAMCPGALRPLRTGVGLRWRAIIHPIRDGKERGIA